MVFAHTVYLPHIFDSDDDDATTCPGNPTYAGLIMSTFEKQNSLSSVKVGIVLPPTLFSQAWHNYKKIQPEELCLTAIPVMSVTKTGQVIPLWALSQ